LGRGGSATDPRAKGQARVSLLKKIKLSDEWRRAEFDGNSFRVAWV